MRTMIIIGLFILLLFIYNYIQISNLYVKKLPLIAKKLSKDLRISQISDYHASSYINTDKLINEISDFNPHIIVLTGDIIDSKTENIKSATELISNILKINSNVFFVSGNHEMNSIYGNDFIYRLTKMGVHILDNSREIMNIYEEKINICGLNFFATRKNYEKTMEGIDEKNYTILLSHSPNRPLSYMSGKEDLILSGHTHGGQVRLPLIGAIVAPGQGYFPKYDKGTFEVGNTILYIDSGLGNSMFPIRLLNRVQISNITVKH